MKKTKANQAVLGVMVTNRTLNAVLVQFSGGDIAVINEFVRHRSGRVAPAQPRLSGMQPGMPGGVQGGLAGADDPGSADFSIQFGDAAGAGADMFLGSEFGGVDASFAEERDEADAGAASGTFEADLAGIIDECRQAGYADLVVAFCSNTTEVSHVELKVTEKQKGRIKPEIGIGKRPERAPQPSDRARRVDRDALLALLRETLKGDVDPERTAFVKMTATEDGLPRYLAVSIRPTDPVSATLAVFRKHGDDALYGVRLLDTEVPVYLGLARLARHAGRAQADASGEEGRSPASGHTLIVRAGVDDTLVLFVQDGQLRHYENMRSLTAFDTPETICSRVLLQQDEYGIDDVDRVLLISQEREDDLVHTFQTFFPEADVAPMRGVLAQLCGAGAARLNEAAFVPALGAALRLSEVARASEAFEDVNLLPKKLLRRGYRLPFTWHVFVLAGVLFCTALFFTARFVSYAYEISAYQDLLRNVPPTLTEADAQVLQGRIDSLQRVHDGYLRALDVLDTLLVGSDRWSRALEKTSREAAAVRGIWIDSWRPQDAQVVITGSATSRDRVVALAERTAGEIESLAFSEIREWPVFSFQLRFPLPNELPEAARYLRERASVATNANAPTPAAEPPSPGPDARPPVQTAAIRSDR